MLLVESLIRDALPSRSRALHSQTPRALSRRTLHACHRHATLRGRVDGPGLSAGCRHRLSHPVSHSDRCNYLRKQRNLVLTGSLHSPGSAVVAQVWPIIAHQAVFPSPLASHLGEALAESPHKFDRARQARGLAEPDVPREQRHAEHSGQCNVQPVVEGDRVPDDPRLGKQFGVVVAVVDQPA